MPTIKEYMDYLQKFTPTKITQSNIASALSTSRSNITHRIKNESQLTIPEVKTIANFFRIQYDHNFLNSILKMDGRLSTDNIGESYMPVEDDVINIDYYPNIFGSCGSGSFVFSENKENIQLPSRLITNYSKFKKYSIINATGDSMTPHILDKDHLIVEHYDGSQIRDNRIYIFRFYDNIFVKRLVLNLDQIIVISDNEKYQQRIIERSEADNFEIIGRIVGIFRTEY